MMYSINWTDKADISFYQNVEYLERDWNATVVNEFLERVETVLRHIETNPFLFPLHLSYRDIRKCVVHERILLYYKILDQQTVDLLVFWNTYQDTKRLKF